MTTVDLTIQAEAVSAFCCTECNSIEEESYGPVYECGECGERFQKEDVGGNRCPDCGKFAAKLADDSLECCCAEAVEILAYPCENCDKLIPQDEAKAHECGVDPAQGSVSIPTFAVGQRVRIPSGQTTIFIHKWLEGRSDPLRTAELICYGPAVIVIQLKYRWGIKCEAHGREAMIDENHLEAVPGDD